MINDSREICRSTSSQPPALANSDRSWTRLWTDGFRRWSFILFQPTVRSSVFLRLCPRPSLERRVHVGACVPSYCGIVRDHQMWFRLHQRTRSCVDQDRLEQCSTVPALWTYWQVEVEATIMRRVASIKQCCAEDLKQGRNVYEFRKPSTPNHAKGTRPPPRDTLQEKLDTLQEKLDMLKRKENSGSTYVDCCQMDGNKPSRKVLGARLRVHFESNDPAETQKYLGMAKLVVPSSRIPGAESQANTCVDHHRTNKFASRPSTLVTSSMSSRRTTASWFSHSCGTMNGFVTVLHDVVAAWTSGTDEKELKHIMGYVTHTVACNLTFTTYGK